MAPPGARSRRIPIDATTSTVDHFIPGIGVDPTTSGANAHLTIVYYYYPNYELHRQHLSVERRLHEFH